MRIPSYASSQNRNEQTSRKHWATNPFFGIIALLVLTAAAFGVYHISKFVILWLNKIGAPDFINVHNIPVWIITIILVITVIGVLRSLTTYLANMVKFVFKIAQSDIVTVVLAIVINAVLLLLNGWITYHLVKFMSYAHVETFFNSNNFLSIIVMFLTLACSLIWIPRIGVYGENRLGQFDDDDGR